MITHVYFVRFRVMTSSSGTLNKPVEGSFIMKRAKFISANKDLEDVKQYVTKYVVKDDVKKVEILALSHLHGPSDI